MFDKMELIWITIILLIVAIGVIVLVLVYQKKQVEFISEKNQLKVAFEKEILESKLEIQEQTMKHISQELHDNIGQVMSLINLNINSINYEDPTNVRDKIKGSSMLVRQVIQDLRDLTKSMHADLISSVGLIKSIENEFNLVKKAVNYTTSLVLTGEPYSLSSQHELILFRVFQEALNNIIRHAGATVITVTASYGEFFRLEINDNGRGFDLSILNGNSPSGLGLKSMRNRTRLIGAEFNITSENNIGTTIKIQMPNSA